MVHVCTEIWTPEVSLKKTLRCDIPRPLRIHRVHIAGVEVKKIPKNLQTFYRRVYRAEYFYDRRYLGELEDLFDL